MTDSTLSPAVSFPRLARLVSLLSGGRLTVVMAAERDIEPYLLPDDVLRSALEDAMGDPGTGAELADPVRETERRRRIVDRLEWGLVDAILAPAGAVPESLRGIGGIR